MMASLTIPCILGESQIFRPWLDRWPLKTQCQDEFRNLSGCVIKILTAGRIYVVSRYIVCFIYICSLRKRLLCWTVWSDIKVWSNFWILAVSPISPGSLALWLHSPVSQFTFFLTLIAWPTGSTHFAGARIPPIFFARHTIASDKEHRWHTSRRKQKVA